MSQNIRLPELNLILLNGRLTRDPEIFFTAGGTAKCSFSIAVNRRIKDSKTNEWKDDVFFMPVVVWDGKVNKQAERCKERLKKGSPVMIEGRLRGREYEDKTGQKRSVLEVDARRVQFLAMASAEGGEGDAPAPRAAAKTAEESEVGEQFEEVPF